MLTMPQASEHRGLRQRISDLESMLAAAEKRCADQTAEVAAAHRDQKSVGRASSLEAGRLACLEGDTAALAQCSLGQLYRLALSQPLHGATARDAKFFSKVSFLQALLSASTLCLQQRLCTE